MTAPAYISTTSATARYIDLTGFVNAWQALLTLNCQINS